MKAKFTKSEWNIKTTGHYYNGERQYKHEVLVDGIGVACFEDSTANAHLIAAAPEMYHMLNRVIQAQKDADNEIEHSDLLHFLYDDIEKLLAKARGEQ